MIASVAAAVREAEPEQGYDERAILARAEDHSVGRFAKDCAHERHRADAAGFLADHLTDVEWRAFQLLPCEGGAVLRGRLDSVGAATVRAALEPLAKRCGAEDQRRGERRYADALIELAHHVLDSGSLPSQGSVRPHLQVVTSVETLLAVAGAPAAELDFSQPIPAATVQRLACDAGTRVLLGPDSAVIDVGRRLRVPSPAQRRALHARDQGCVWPGCDRPASWTSAHHLLHWTRDQGPTEIPNLVLLCYRHHWHVHEGGWNLVRTDDGGVLKIPPLESAPRAHEPGPPSADDEGWRAQQRRLSQWEALHPPQNMPPPGAKT